MDIGNGYLKSFTFKKESFFIARIATKDGYETIKYSGSLPIPKLDGQYRFFGDKTTHKSYGDQYNIYFYLPTDGASDTISYWHYMLPSQSDGFVASLFTKYGSDLVREFEDSDDLSKFLGQEAYKSIKKEYDLSLSRAKFSVEWLSLGLNITQLNKIWDKWGISLIDILKDRPYDLVYEDSYIFSVVDGYCTSRRYALDDPDRIKALVYSGLQNACDSEGHVSMPSSELYRYIKEVYIKYGSIEKISFLDSFPDRLYYTAVSELIKNRFLEEKFNNLYTRQNLHVEEETAKNISIRLKNKPLKFTDLDEFINQYESRNSIQLSCGQKQALGLVKRKKCVLITGYPGTGKTLVVDALVMWCKQSNLSVSLMSPTGIAAKRLSQVTRTPASTIHRALGCDKEGNWTFDRVNKFKSDVLIIDEMSMVDARLFHRILTSVDNSTCIVMVGDPAQLPSVGSGDVLNQLVKCPKIPSVRLEKIYRQAGTSRITELAHDILSGSVTQTSFDPKSEVIHIQSNENEALEEIVKLAGELKLRDKQFQVIAPIYESVLGVNNLNRSLRPVLNTDISRASKYKLMGEDIFEGDRVIVIKNDYERSIYNGDTGKVVSLDLHNSKARIKIFNWSDGNSMEYTDKFLEFGLAELDKYFKVAFATSVHRTQGNEYDFVILPMTYKFGHMLYKNLVYTAITRARKKVFIIGDQNAFLMSVKNERQSVRYSSLSDMI